MNHFSFCFLIDWLMDRSIYRFIHQGYSGNYVEIKSVHRLCWHRGGQVFSTPITERGQRFPSLQVSMCLLPIPCRLHYLRWTRRDVFIHINSFTKNTKIGTNLVQEASHLKIALLLDIFCVCNFLWKMSHLVHHSPVTMKLQWSFMST